jgi:hypothetical protein
MVTGMFALVNAEISKPQPPTGASATACRLGNESGWLFDLDPEDGYYYDDLGGAAPEPVVQQSQSGIWKFPDSPVGNPGDQNKHYVVTLVLASRSRAATTCSVAKANAGIQGSCSFICTCIRAVGGHHAIPVTGDV